jgi:hypothetical protein
VASQHIEIPGATASRLSGDLRQLIDQLQRTVDHATRIKAVADQVASGSDWVSLGAAWGVSAANAETVYNLLTAAQGRLTGAAISDFLSRLG